MRSLLTLFLLIALAPQQTILARDDNQAWQLIHIEADREIYRIGMGTELPILDTKDRVDDLCVIQYVPGDNLVSLTSWYRTVDCPVTGSRSCAGSLNKEIFKQHTESPNILGETKRRSPAVIGGVFLCFKTSQNLRVISNSNQDTTHE
jgi:hypothetical protein